MDFIDSPFDFAIYLVVHASSHFMIKSFRLSYRIIYDAGVVRRSERVYFGFITA
jgi:hypothetical protein